MKQEIRKAAIEAIKTGDIAKLKALRIMAGQSTNIPVYFQVLGSDQLYTQDGRPTMHHEPNIPEIDGLLPEITSIVVVFPSEDVFEEALLEDHPEGATLRKLKVQA